MPYIAVKNLISFLMVLQIFCWRDSRRSCPPFLSLSSPDMHCWTSHSVHWRRIHGYNCDAGACFLTSNNLWQRTRHMVQMFRMPTCDKVATLAHYFYTPHLLHSPPSTSTLTCMCGCQHTCSSFTASAVSMWLILPLLCWYGGCGGGVVLGD